VEKRSAVKLKEPRGSRLMKGKARLDRPDKVENVSEAFISDLNNSARIADARGKSALTVESGCKCKLTRRLDCIRNVGAELLIYIGTVMPAAWCCLVLPTHQHRASWFSFMCIFRACFLKLSRRGHTLPTFPQLSDAQM